MRKPQVTFIMTPDEELFLEEMIPNPELNDHDLEMLYKQQDSDALNEILSVELALHPGG